MRLTALTTTAAAPLTLTPAHYRHLKASGIPDSILAEEGVYSLRPDDPFPTPNPVFRHPNSHKGRRFPTWPEELAEGEAIVFPNRDHAGRPNYRLRPDTPRVVREENYAENE